MSDPFAHAVALMDQHFPEWWKRINLNLLDLASLDNCVICQQFLGHSRGHWSAIIEKMLAPSEDPNAPWVDYFCSRKHHVEWVAEILRRRELVTGHP